MYKLRRASNLMPLTLNPKAALGAGGEGSVFEVGNRLAAKLYRKPSEAIQNKLKTMLVQQSPDAQDESIAWPMDLLLDESGIIVGFLMPQAIAAQPIVDYYNPKTRLGFSPSFNYRDLHCTARNLAAAVEKLHEQGYVIGDLNESNILVTQTAQVTLVDADSIQVIDGENLYRCRVGKAEFMPPELQGQNLSEVTRTDEQDNFALAILIFQTLMEGCHPFAGIYTGEGEPPSLAARIAAAHFPYSGQSVPYRPSPLALPLTLLHPKIQEFFQRCFVDSQRNPQIRPTAAQWHEALTVAEQELRSCTVNIQHAYGSHLATCPWCERKNLLKGRDPFPAKVETPKESVSVIATAKDIMKRYGFLSYLLLINIPNLLKIPAMLVHPGNPPVTTITNTLPSSTLQPSPKLHLPSKQKLSTQAIASKNLHPPSKKAKRFYDQAEAFFQENHDSQALMLYRKSLDEMRAHDSQLHAKGLVGVASCLIRQGKASNALPNLKLAEAMFIRLNDVAGHANADYNLGIAYRQMNQLDNALNFYQTARFLSSEAHIPQLGSVLNNMGGVYLAQGRTTEALDTYQEALTEFTKSGVPTDRAIALVNIGTVYGYLGQTDMTIASYQEASKIYRKASKVYKNKNFLRKAQELDEHIDELKQPIPNFSNTQNFSTSSDIKLSVDKFAAPVRF